MTPTPRYQWPALPTTEWASTLSKLHLWSQMIGKIRMQHDAWINHSWGVVLHVTPRGLATPLIPGAGGGFAMSLDVYDAVMRIDTSNGERRELALDDTTIAQFYDRLATVMGELALPLSISTMPSEIADAVRFEDDERRLEYVAEHARAFHQALVHADRVMARFRADFVGKASPINFFWGSFDLATARFSGRDAPAHPGGLPNLPIEVAVEAYSHELTSAGFYPGNADAPDPFFYSYAYPAPPGFEHARLRSPGARYDDGLGEFVLPYAAVASADDPDGTLLAFFGDVHEAAAELADWDRALHCEDPMGPDWWRRRVRDR